jgi:hypothetical protein
VRALVVLIEVGIDLVSAHGRNLAAVVRSTTLATLALKLIIIAALFALLVILERKDRTRSGLGR